MTTIHCSRLDHLMLVHKLDVPEEIKRLAVTGVPGKENESRFKVMHAMVRADHSEEDIRELLRCPDLGIAPKDKGKINKAYVEYELKRIVGAREKLTPAYVKDLNAEYFIAREGKNTSVYWSEYDEGLERSQWESSSFNALKQYLMHDKVNVGTPDRPKMMSKVDLWLNHPARRTYRGLKLRPNKGPEFDGYFNLWQRFNVGEEVGSCDLYKQHLLEVICSGNAENFAYLWKWMARAVQKPHARGMVAIAMRGKMGTGKGLFADSFGSIFGQHYVHLTSSRQLTGNFNSHMRDCIFLFADEVNTTGDKEARSTLQRYCTEKSISIEGKGKDIVQVANMLHIVLATNDRQIIAAGKNERRYLVLDVSPEHMQDDKYFKPLINEIENGGKEAILRELQNVDLTGFDVNKVPKTEALIDQQIGAMEPLERFFFDQLRNEILCNTKEWNKVSRQEFYHHYSTSCHNMGRYPEARETVGKTLKKWGARGGRHTVAIRDSKKRANAYAFHSVEECQSWFAEDLGWSSFDWDSEPEEDTPEARERKRVSQEAEVAEDLTPPDEESLSDEF